MQHGHLGEPAIDPALGAGRDEDDIAIGQVGGLDVVVGAVGELAQAGAVDVDFVKQVVLGPAFAVAEEDLLSVVVDLGIANAAAGVGQQGGEFAGGEVPAIELGALAPGFSVRIVRVIAHVGVPVPVGLVRLAGAEDELVHARHRPGAESGQQRVAGLHKLRGFAVRAEVEVVIDDPAPVGEGQRQGVLAGPDRVGRDRECQRGGRTLLGRIIDIHAHRQALAGDLSAVEGHREDRGRGMERGQANDQVLAVRERPAGLEVDGVGVGLCRRPNHPWCWGG